MLLLLVFAAVAIFYELIRNSTGAANTYPEQIFKEVAALFYGERKPALGDFTKYYLSRLPLLVSLLTVAGTIWRGATAFGVKPASLMASMSRGVRVRDLDAQTSFRQRFASEFRDVTEALGARSMIVFIDDLDRCRPENVVETLEAVNFLVSSGECFVVIGMARERVEPCVGLSFKDVAAEMLDEGGALREAPAARGQAGEDGEDPKRLQEERARRKRLEYARQYLDKLINIEVPVPVPTSEQSCGILVANSRREEELTGAPRRGWRRLLPAGAEALASDYGRLLSWGLGIVLLLSLCYALASFLARPLPGADTAAGEAAQPSPSPAEFANVNANTSANARVNANTSANANGNFSANANRNVNANRNANTSPAASARAVRAELTPGKRSVLLAALPVLLVVLAVAWVSVWVLTRRPGLVVKDSPKFIDALKIWHPLVFARSSTPRSVKRFMNRVRYLAMRQRRQKDDPPAWKRLLTRFSSTEPGAADAEKEQQVDGAVHIPDELLVALAAIQHFNQRWLTNVEALLPEPSKEEPSNSVLAGAHCDKDDWALLQKAKAEHVRAFGYWGGDAIVNARNKFLRISKGVQVN